MTRPSDTTIELIRRLVGFDTVSRKSNRELIGFVRDYLADLGIDSRLVPDATGAKANLFATIGPAGKPGVVLSGHTDVVPVDGQDWSSDPFTAVETDGKLFGRGTADMKSFLAVALALAPEMAERDFATPISLAFSYDEEIGCVGVRGLLAALADMKIKPQACIVGEPTGMKVVTGHKGKAAMRCTVRGHACHSALAPYGVNAVEMPRCRRGTFCCAIRRTELHQPRGLRITPAPVLPSIVTQNVSSKCRWRTNPVSSTAGWAASQSQSTRPSPVCGLTVK